MLIGKLDIGHKVLLAPMADISDGPFRKVAKHYGAGLTFTQMVSAKGVIENNFDTLRFLSFPRSEKPIGAQILGNDPKIFSKAVKDIARYNPDAIDLNCGCPVPKVTKHNMGSSILEDTKLLGRLVKSMVESSGGIPISIKMRLGTNEKRINIIENAKEAEENGASFVIIHTRTRNRKYDENPDWEWLSKVKENVSIPVVGNGSLFEPEDIKNMIDSTGCDSVMIARGALGNPFLFSRYNELLQTGKDPGKPSLDVIKDTAIMHVKLAVKEFGEVICVNNVKKNVIWYFRKERGIQELLDLIFTFNSASELIDFIEGHVEKIHNGEYVESSRVDFEASFLKKVQFWKEENEK